MMDENNLNFMKTYEDFMCSDIPSQERCQMTEEFLKEATTLLKNEDEILRFFKVMMDVICSVGDGSVRDANRDMLLFFAEIHHRLFLTFLEKFMNSLERLHVNQPWNVISTIHHLYKSSLLFDLPSSHVEIPVIITKFFILNKDFHTCLNSVKFLDEYFNDMEVYMVASSLSCAIIEAASTFKLPVVASKLNDFRRDIGIISSFTKRLIEASNVKSLITKCTSLISCLLFQTNTKSEETPRPKGLSIAVADIVNMFPSDVFQQCLEEVSLHFSECGNLENDNLFNIGVNLFRWLSWPRTRNVGHYVLLYIRFLLKIKKEKLLIELYQKEMNKVLFYIRLPALRGTSVDVFINFHLAFLKHQALFYKHHEDLAIVINLLKKENSESSDNALRRLAEVIHLHMSLHPFLVRLCPSVVQSIKDLPIPTKECLEKLCLISGSILKENPDQSRDRRRELLFVDVAEQENLTFPRGLLNNGNTCYINCIIQVLFSCSQFSKEIMMSEPIRTLRFGRALRTTFAFLHMSMRPNYNPAEITETCVPKDFDKFLQQDCLEFLLHLLNGLKDEQSKLTNESIASQNFEGKMLNILKCRECHHESRVVENFFSLLIQVPQDSDNHKLQDLLENHFKREVLTGSSSYLCQKCKTDVEAEMSKRILFSPRYLIISLLRFRYDRNTCLRKKITSPVECQEYITVPISTEEDSSALSQADEVLSTSSQCGDDNKIFTACVSDDKLILACTDDISHDNENMMLYPKESCDSDKSSIYQDAKSCLSSDVKNQKAGMVTYKLKSAVIHSGRTTEHGHYYCFAHRNYRLNFFEHSSALDDPNNSRSASEVWFRLDDNRTELSNFEELCYLASKSSEDTPYILIYQRSDYHESPVLPVTELPVDLKQHVESDNKLFKEEKKYYKPNSVASNTSAKNWVDGKKDNNDDDEEGCATSGENFLQGPRMIF